MELILETELNASEIAFRVGISSPAYFSKCFHEYYGFPPGEARKRHFSAGKEEEKTTPTKVSEPDTKVANKAESPNSLKPSKLIKILMLFSAVIAIALLLFYVVINRKPDFFRIKRRNCQ
jgi:hypothetical protein